MTRGKFSEGARAIGLAALLAAAGCGPQLQTQVVGRTAGVAALAASGSPALAVDINVPESQDTQVLRYVVSLPRATHLAYRIECPTVHREGTLGQTFEQYRTRRLAELERERQQEARAIGSLVGAFVPGVRAQGAVAGPGGAATATAQIDPGAAATAVATATLPPRDLPPGDVGADVVRGSVQLGATGAGRCALTLTPDPADQDARGAQAVLELVRIVDLEAQARARAAAVRAQQDGRARTLRVSVIASLERAGADPLARERRAAAERERLAAVERDRQARAQLDLQVRLAKENEARLVREKREEEARLVREKREEEARLVREKREAEARLVREREWRTRQASFALRWNIEARLVSQGADPDFRRKQEWERMSARREAEHRAIEARLERERQAAEGRRAAFDLRFRVAAHLQGEGADPEFRRKRDEAMLREVAEQARRDEEARAVAAERVRVETQAAIDLRVLAKVRLHQLGAVDRPPCPPVVVETPPTPPFPTAVWIAGRHEWNGAAWIWIGGHYQQAPRPGAVWVPPAEISVSGTVVIRAGRWVNVTATLGSPSGAR